MKTSQIIFLGLALFLVAQSAAGHHTSNCGLGPGSDACGCSEVVVRAAKPIRPVKFADPYVIKEAHSRVHEPVKQGCGSLNPPRKIYGPSVTDLLKHTGGPIAPRFHPVGDLCTTCSKSIAEVVPAYPGKPVCRSCAEKAKLCESGCVDPYHSSHLHSNRNGFRSLSSSNDELNAFEDECLSFDEQESIYNGQPVQAVAPADPVSLSLAYGLARQSTRTIPEGSLAFGPRSTPTDGSVRKTTPNIAEERLLTVERPVVELRLTPKSSASATYNEVLAQQEALEQQRLELEAEAEENQGQEPAFISYSDLGYAPVTSTGNNFVSTIVSADPGSSDHADADDVACGPVGRPIPGYVSGNVIIRREETRESDPDYYGDGSYEDGYDQDEDQYGSNSSEESEPCDGSSGFLARLRASARAQNSRGHGHGHGHGHGCGCGCGQ